MSRSQHMYFRPINVHPDPHIAGLFRCEICDSTVEYVRRLGGMRGRPQKLCKHCLVQAIDYWFKECEKFES